MLWLLSKLVKILIFLIIIGAIVAIGAIFFVNPNNFKTQINAAIQTYTGLPFQINGSISWNLRPNATLNVQKLALYQTGETKTPVLQIKDANILFDLFSYFKGQLVVSNLTLTEVTLDWAQTKAFVASAPKKPCLIQKLDANNVSITMLDGNDHLNWELNNATISASNVMLGSNAAIPGVTISGDLTNINNNVAYKIDTTIKVDLSKHDIMLDPLKMSWHDTPFQGNALVEHYDSDPLVSGTLSLDTTDLSSFLQKLDPYYASNPEKSSHNMQMHVTFAFDTKAQTVDFSKLHLELDKGAIDGNLKFALASPYNAEFSLAADNLNVTPLTLLGKAVFPRAPASGLLPTDILKNLTIHGKLVGSKLSFNDIAIDQLSATVVGQGGIIQFTPVVMAAFGGNHNMTLNVDVITKGHPFFQFTEEADKIEIEPFLKLANLSLLTGNASLKASLEAEGNDVAALKQTISGGINLYVNDGTFYGLDAMQLMQFTTQTVNDIFTQMSKTPSMDLRSTALKRSSDWITSQQNAPKTGFSHFEFKADLKLGESKKSSIAMNNDVIDLKGTGDFNLADNSIDFNTKITNMAAVNASIKELATDMQQTPLTMLITGTLQKPTFGPDIQAYAYNVIKLAQTNLLNQAISKMVAVTPPNAKTAKTATDIFLDSLQSLNK